jgi:hypothetical protein
VGGRGQVAPGGFAADFEGEVLPLLLANCAECHGQQQSKALLRLDSWQGLRAGSYRGRNAVLVPGNAEESLLLRRVRGLVDGEDRMPPTGPGLAREEIELLRAWIEAGALGPGGAAFGPGAGERLAADTGSLEGGGDPVPRDPAGTAAGHWAYVPPQRPALPAVSDLDWCLSPVDRFVMEQLEARGLAPSPTADPETLLRRVTLDLTGLPPTPEERAQWLADTSESAYQSLLTRLLESPAYGEHMARSWLDLARYADSNGYEKDDRRVAWPWRDWVIAAYQQDLGFDRFTIEQLAGDLLPEPTLEQQVATGFHRNTMLNFEGGTDPEEFRVAAVIDRVNTTASVWLGTTLACAQCHNHKYDPFSQREYFEFLAFFNSTQDTGNSSEPVVTLANWPPTTPATESAPAAAQSSDAASSRQSEVDAAALGAQPGANAGETTAAGDLQAMVLAELPQPRPTHLFVRGSFLSPGEPVEPGVPAALHAWPLGAPKNRLGLARWLVSRDNPLTARVLVNREWARLFGRGLVEPLDDFGSRSEAPSHGALLDWLAVEFMEQGWSHKQLLRTLLSSATYRQAARVTPAHLEVDPLNRWLGRAARLRLDAEVLRDCALSAAGLLDPTIGGPSAFPPQPAGIWASTYSSDQWMADTGPGRFRRGLYTFLKRTAPYPSFMTFDASSRELTCLRRTRSNTPLQALTLLNDPAFVEAAAGLARSLLLAELDDGVEDEQGNGARLQLGFLRCLGREASAAELGILVGLLDAEVERYRLDPAAAEELLLGLNLPVLEGAELERPTWAAWTVVANTLLNLDEFVTRE